MSLFTEKSVKLNHINLKSKNVFMLIFTRLQCFCWTQFCLFCAQSSRKTSLLLLKSKTILETYPIIFVQSAAKQ